MPSSMENMLYSAVGTVSIATDKVKELIEDLMQNNDYTQDEGRRIVKAFLGDMEDAKAHINNRVYVLVDEILLKLNLPSQDQIHKKVDKIKSDAANHPINKKLRKEKGSAIMHR